MTSTTHDVTVAPGRILRIKIDQTGQSQSGNHSDVRVRGIMVNNTDYRDWNLYNNIGRWISGTADYHPGNFGFDLPPHSQYTFIDHTFTIEHNSDGTKSVNFTVKYGDTQIAGWGANKTSSDSLTLDRIAKHPDPPGQPQFSNITPTSLTVSWSAADGNGASVDDYRLRRWTGSSQSGDYVDSTANNRTRNVSGLIPGQTYTFAVYAHNSAGWSSASTDNHIGLLGGGYIRVGNEWKAGIPYVRADGTWHQAVPYVRSGGTWHIAE